MTDKQTVLRKMHTKTFKQPSGLQDSETPQLPSQEPPGWVTTKSPPSSGVLMGSGLLLFSPVLSPGIDLFANWQKAALCLSNTGFL